MFHILLCPSSTRRLHRRSGSRDLNDSLGRMEQLMKDTAGATDALSCGAPDRDSNDVRYLQEALDMIEDFQRWDSRRDVAEIILVERQR